MNSIIVAVGFLLVSLSSAAVHPNYMPWQDLLSSNRISTDSDRLTFRSSLEFERQWESFRLEYGKNYADDKEEIMRRAIFEQNLKKIEKHNFLYQKGLKSFTLGINQFADLELTEFLKLMTCYTHRNLSGSSSDSNFLSPDDDTAVPSSIDWRTKGYVTPVKNQRSCGSCWAFSATGSLEGQNFRKIGKLVSLSEQNLVDCSRSFGNQGCNGGWMDYAFKYVKTNGGIDTEDSYPYEGKDGTCRYNPATVGGHCSGFVDILKGSEKNLQTAVSTIGPVSVAIDAGHSSFQLYKSGIYNEPQCSSTALDHGVLAVGYATTSAGQDYWIIKNSWGVGWGNQGYIWMSRNKNNQCGIATAASYPLV